MPVFSLDPIPRTEEDIWYAIEQLGNRRTYLRNALEKKEDSDLQELLVDVNDTLLHWVRLAAKRFRLVLPWDCSPESKAGSPGPSAPNGKIWWWDWQRRWAAHADAEIDRAVKAQLDGIIQKIETKAKQLDAPDQKA